MYISKNVHYWQADVRNNTRRISYLLSIYITPIVSLLNRYGSTQQTHYCYICLSVSVLEQSK